MWRKTAKVSIFLIPLGIFLAAMLNYFKVFEPNLKFFELTTEEQAKVVNGSLKFVEVDLKFYDLFNATDSDFLNSLYSNQLKTLNNGGVLNLSEPLNKHLEDEIFLTYSNLTENLKPKLINSCVKFQGHDVITKQILGNESAIYSALDSNQIFQMSLFGIS